MNKNLSKIWATKNCEELSNTLAQTNNLDTMQEFLADLLTEKEIIEISARLRAATMLAEGSKYDQIIAETNLSTRTVARISKWLKHGTGGYAKVIGTHIHI